MSAELTPQLDIWASYHDWLYASSTQARQLFEKSVNEQGVDDFQNSPAGQEWVAKYNHGAVGELNAEKMLAWLREHNVPGTGKNLAWVFHTLKQEGQLDEAFETVEPAPQPAVIIRSQTDEVEAATPVEPAESFDSLDKLSRDPNVSDADRKLALKRMAVLAQAERIRNRTTTFKPTFMY